MGRRSAVVVLRAILFTDHSCTTSANRWSLYPSFSKLIGTCRHMWSVYVYNTCILVYIYIYLSHINHIYTDLLVIYIWGFPKIGVPKHGWFIFWNIYLNGWSGVPPFEWTPSCRGYKASRTWATHQILSKLGRGMVPFARLRGYTGDIMGISGSIDFYGDFTARQKGGFDQPDTGIVWDLNHEEYGFVETLGCSTSKSYDRSSICTFKLQWLRYPPVLGKSSYGWQEWSDSGLWWPSI